MLWQSHGYFVLGRARVVNGPSLDKLIASHDAYQAGLSLPLDFYIREGTGDLGRRGQRIKGCVASMERLDKDRVNLRLVNHPDNQSEFSYNVVLGYNHQKHVGSLEEYRRQKEIPLHYNPAHLPTTDDMMKMNDREFILLYGLHMMVYQLSDHYEFPIQCHRRGCDFVIQHPLDMRKLAGQCLCPRCFPIEVEESEDDNPYLNRAAKLLPRRPLAVSYWPVSVVKALNDRND
jgi:hypothetical protein